MIAGCGFSKKTIAGMRRSGRDAPLPAVRCAQAKRVKSEHASLGRGSLRGGVHTAASLYRSRDPEDVDCRGEHISEGIA